MPSIALRKAIRSLDKEAARNLQLDRLALWVPEVLEVDLEDSKQVRRLARLYLLSQIPWQTFQVMYRSSAPGRPLVPLDEGHSFPDARAMERAVKDSGGERNIYVAARLPTWRVVWKIQL